jgi:hypothetical protein
VDDFRQMVSIDELTSGDTIALARTAAEAVRGLNHATRHEDGLGQPSVAYDVLGALSLAASRTGQALAAGCLGHDAGEDPALSVGGAAAFLGDARLSAAALAGDLDAAQQQLALLNGRPGPRNRKDQP